MFRRPTEAFPLRSAIRSTWALPLAFTGRKPHKTGRCMGQPSRIERRNSLPPYLIRADAADARLPICVGKGSQRWNRRGIGVVILQSYPKQFGRTARPDFSEFDACPFVHTPSH